nr:pleiotropic drug resistance protein 1 [Quercus suber]
MTEPHTLLHKAEANEGQEASVVTDYILKVLELEACADTMLGDEKLRGISGGQKKRVTTGDIKGKIKSSIGHTKMSPIVLSQLRTSQRHSNRSMWEGDQEMKMQHHITKEKATKLL